MKLFISLALVASLLGCATNDGSVLTIRFVAAPSTSCEFTPTGTLFYSVGYFDPSGGGTYVAVLNLSNSSTATESTTRSQTHNIDIVGFDACWARTDSSLVGGGDAVAGTGLLFDCDDVPASQKGFFPSAGRVPQGGGLGLADLLVLSLPNLQAPGIYGPDFNPNGSPSTLGSYPETTTSGLILNIRAQGKFTSGGTVTSQWFSFPVTVCLFCTPNSCAGVDPVVCGDASAGFAGEVVGEGSCLPFSGGDIACEEFSTCDA